MAKRSVRDMLKARAWNRQVSLADVDPGDRLGVKRKKIAAAREKYGPNCWTFKSASTRRRNRRS